MKVSAPAIPMTDSVAFEVGAQTKTREVRFSELVDRQSRFVFRVAYARLRNVEDSEDVVQETFLKIFRSHAWERMVDERAFLARTAWRLAGDKGKRSRRDEQTDTELPGSTPSPEAKAIAGFQQAAIRRTVDSLPEDLRLPLVLSSMEELTSRQVGEMLNIPEGTVRRRLHTARELVRQKFSALEGRTR